MEQRVRGFGSIDEYIATFPAHIQSLLGEVRATIKAAAPDAEERISYSMPAFALNGTILIYFAALKKHIGLYPTSSGIAAFKEEVAGYKSTKGAVQFPLDQPLPTDLIARIVKFRVTEVLDKATAKYRK